MGFGKYVPLFEEYYNEKINENESQSQNQSQGQAQDASKSQETSQSETQDKNNGTQGTGDEKSSKSNGKKKGKTCEEKANDIVKNGGSIEANTYTREKIISLWRDDNELKEYDEKHQITLEEFKKKCSDSNNIICILTSSRKNKDEHEALDENDIIRNGLLKFPGTEVYNCIGGYQGTLDSSLIAVYSGEKKTLFSMCCFNYGAKYEQDSIMIKCDDGVFHFVTSNEPASEDNIVGDFTVSEIRKIEDNEKLGEYFTIVDHGKTAFAIE